MSDIFVQLNTKSGMAYFYDASLPDGAVEQAPEHVLFIPIDQSSEIEGGNFYPELTDWYIIKYLRNDKLEAQVVKTDNVIEHITTSAHIDTNNIVSLDRLTVDDFNGTPFYFDLGEKYVSKELP